MSTLFERPVCRMLCALVLAWAMGCSEVIEPDPPGTVRPPAELDIIELPADHPPFLNDSIAFYAKVGRQARATLYLQKPGGGRGDEFAELRLKPNTLESRPDGSPFGPNDSVLIVVKASEQNQLLVQMRPGGLGFSSQQPAELELNYEATGGDLDRNGKRDKEDERIEKKLGIWVQETPGDAFVKVGTAKVKGKRRLVAQITSFSRFAIAY